MTLIEVFVAIDEEGGISRGGGIPWYIQGDQARLARLIKPYDGERVAYIMGSGTYAAMPHKEGVDYFVLSRKGDPAVSSNAKFHPTCSEEDARNILEKAAKDGANDGANDESVYDRIVILGGAGIYALFTRYATRLHVTQISGNAKCDQFFTFPSWINRAHREVVIEDTVSAHPDDHFSTKGLQFGDLYTITVYTRAIGHYHDIADNYESQYFGLVRNRIDYGILGDNRTETKTKVIPGGSISASLNYGAIPLLTSKKMGVKSIFAELCWFLNGMTDNKWLKDHYVHIWNSDAVRHGSDELGKIYGHQWRNFGGELGKYGTGVDQVAECVRQLRDDPMSRRIIINAWNPAELSEMALPPCHVMYQFIVRMSGNDKLLTCIMTQRSADLGLGVPFNLASTALLTHIMARVTGCIAERVQLNFGNAHVYENHISALREQTTRKVYDAPYIQFANDAPMDLDIGSWQPHHLTVNHYQCGKQVSMSMSGGAGLLKRDPGDQSADDNSADKA